jgi:hypothetical protein
LSRLFNSTSGDDVGTATTVVGAGSCEGAGNPPKLFRCYPGQLCDSFWPPGGKRRRERVIPFGAVGDVGVVGKFFHDDNVCDPKEDGEVCAWYWLEMRPVG